MVISTFDNLKLLEGVRRNDAKPLFTIAGLYPEDIFCTGLSERPGVLFGAYVTTSFSGSVSLSTQVA